MLLEFGLLAKKVIIGPHNNEEKRDVEPVCGPSDSSLASRHSEHQILVSLDVFDSEHSQIISIKFKVGVPRWRDSYLQMRTLQESLLKYLNQTTIITIYGHRQTTVIKAKDGAGNCY